MHKKKKKFLSIVMTSLFIGTLFIANPVSAQANRTFKNYLTHKIYLPGDYRNDPAVFQELIELISDPDTAANMGVEFQGNFYSYVSMYNRVVNRTQGETVANAFAAVLRDQSTIIEKATTSSAVQAEELALIPPVKDYNLLLGCTDVKVNNTALVKSITVDGIETTYQTANATTLKIFTNSAPYNITLTSTSGKTVVALNKPKVTLTVTTVKDYNPILGYMDIKVNDTSLVDKVIVDGSELPSVSVQKVDGTILRIFPDTEPTQVVLKTQDGTEVTAFNKK